MEDLIVVSKQDKLIIDTPEIKGWIRPRSIFSRKSPLIKIRYAFRRNIDPELFMDLLTYKRRLWDKEVELYENLPLSDGWVIYRYILKPPLSFMNPLYFVEKRLIFEENGVFYG